MSFYTTCYLLKNFVGSPRGSPSMSAAVAGTIIVFISASGIAPVTVPLSGSAKVAKWPPFANVFFFYFSPALSSSLFPVCGVQRCHSFAKFPNFFSNSSRSTGYQKVRGYVEYERNEIRLNIQAHLE